MTTERQERDQSVDDEKCPRCRKPKDKEVTTKWCPTCLKKARQNAKGHEHKRRRKRKVERVAKRAAGLCTHNGCNNEVVPGYASCAGCIHKTHEHHVAHYAQKRASNTCSVGSCNKPCEKDRTMCSECLAAHNEMCLTLYYKKKAAGLCIRCPIRLGVPAEPGYIMCRRHLDDDVFKKWVRNHPGQDPVIA